LATTDGERLFHSWEIEADHFAQPSSRALLLRVPPGLELMPFGCDRRDRSRNIGAVLRDNRRKFPRASKSGLPLFGLYRVPIADLVL